MLVVVALIWNAAVVAPILHGRGTLNTAGACAALVTDGPYRLSRNPMYRGLALLYGGLPLVFSVTWALPLLVPVLIYTQARVIAPEERYLERAFGDAYHAYRARVRRWI